MTYPAVRLVRPLQTEYMVVGKLLRYYAYDFYTLTEDQFLKECMSESGGSMNPARVKELYHQLREEAGLK